MRYHLCTDNSDYNCYLGSFEAADNETAGQYAIDWLIKNSHIDPDDDEYMYENIGNGAILITVKIEYRFEHDYYLLNQDKEI